MFNDFTPTGISQLNLFDEVQPRAHNEELMKVLTNQGLKKYGLRAGDCTGMEDEAKNVFSCLRNLLERYTSCKIYMKIWRFHYEIH